MRPSVGLAGLLLAVATSVHAQGASSSVSQSTAAGTSSTSTAQTTSARTTSQPASAQVSFARSTSTSQTTSQTTTVGTTGTTTTGNGGLANLPTLAGVGVPNQQVPDTAGAPFMQKSNLPDGTVFICVGAILAFFGAAVLAWRGLVAWSLHRSVKRAATAQNLADIKAMSAVPGKKRGMYNVVGANSTMSLDHLSAAPLVKSNKPFAQAAGGSPSHSSLFFSPTAGAAGGAAGLRDSVANRSSNYLPAGYYAAGNAAPAAGAPMTHVGGHGANLSAHSLGTAGNRYSSRSGMSPPESPSLPPSRGNYARAPPSRDGLSVYNRNSVATLGTPGNSRGVYGQGGENISQLSLNLPGGSATGGRAPSAYLEDLFENHGSGAPRERF